MERVKTGIYGLDELIEGGFPRGRTILVSGGCGTGKSIFGMQYAYLGATEFNEPSIFVTLDERPKMLREDMLRFGWDISKAEKKGNFILIDGSSAKIGYPSDEKYSLPQTGVNIDRLLLKLTQAIDQIEAKRVVIDSIAGIGLQAEKEQEIRKAILKVNYLLMKTDVTTVITSEIPEQIDHGPLTFSKYGVEEYVADGVIILSYSHSHEEYNRTMFIRKMRGTKHSEDILPMQITSKGIVVRTPEEAFNL